jgi:hypothetical protein
MQEEVVLGELAEWIYYKTGLIISPDESCHIAEVCGPPNFVSILLFCYSFLV